MGKVYAQHTGSAWEFSGSIVSTGSANSGSFLTRGYNRLVGAIYISGSLTSGSGLHIWQSIDDGTNWDVVHNYAPSTVGTSSYDIEVVGERMFISASPGADDISAFRALFYLQPIGLGTVGLKVGSIDVGNVIVDEISKIQQRVSASISSGSITILSPAGSDFHAVLETSTSVIGSIAGVNARVSASIASGSVTVLSPAGSDLHAILETSTSAIGAISSVQGQVSASVSGGSVAMLAGANDVGIVHVGTGTCSMGNVASIEGRISASLASGSVTVLSPAGSDLHAILETSSSVIGVISGINSRVSASLASGSVTVLSSAGSDLHAVLETSSSVIGVISGINSRVSASLASGSVTVLSPAGSDLHAVLETSSSVIGVISGINARVSASIASGSITTLSPAGSDMRVVLETSTSVIGKISSASITSPPSKSVWSGSGTISGCDAGVGVLATSNTVDVTGFGRLTGILYTSASLAAASGLRVSQSGNDGANFDILTACLPAAAGTSAFSYEIYGNAVKVDVRAGSSEVSYRSYWFVRQGQ